MSLNVSKNILLLFHIKFRQTPTYIKTILKVHIKMYKK